MFRNCFRILLLILSQSFAAIAQQQRPAWQPIAASATFTTGDTWTSEGITYRLYGVQACLRGTSLTLTTGDKRDCGAASMMMLIKLVQQWHPVCYPVYHNADNTTQFVICSARVAQNNSTTVVDLGTALISSGFSFASLNANAHPVNPAYLVSQMMAKKQQRGLWASPNLPDPNEAIMQNLRKSN